MYDACVLCRKGGTVWCRTWYCMLWGGGEERRGGGRKGEGENPMGNNKKRISYTYPLHRAGNPTPVGVYEYETLDKRYANTKLLYKIKIILSTEMRVMSTQCEECGVSSL